MTETTTYTTSGRTKYLLVAVAVVLAFFAAYGIASGRSAGTVAASGSGTVAGSGAVDPAACDPSAAATSECGGSCCGTGSGAIESTATAAVEGDVQKISVDVSAGYFNPSAIRVQAGVPVEITFGEGSGCMAEVMFKDFAVFEDLTEGGAVVNLPALEPGEYSFSCGMEMVFGTVIAE